MSKDKPTRKVKEKEISPFPPMRRGLKDKSLLYESKDKSPEGVSSHRWALNAKLEPLHGDVEKMLYQKPDLVWEDKDGNEVKFLSVSKASGEPLGEGKTTKRWLRKDTRPQIEQLDPTGKPTIDPTTQQPRLVPNPALSEFSVLVDVADVKVFEVKDGVKTPYTRPESTDKLEISEMIAEEDLKNNFVFDEGVWQIWEVSGAGKKLKRTDQQSLQAIAEDLYYKYGERMAESEQRTSTLRKGYIGIVQNLIMTTPKMTDRPEPRMGLVFAEMDENGFHLLLRTTNQEIDPFHIPYPRKPVKGTSVQWTQS